MSLKSYVRPRFWLAGGAVLVAVATASVVVTGGNAMSVENAGLDQRKPCRRGTRRSPGP
jgi:hypothetical protein